MGIELPAELADIAQQTGVKWPQADEDAMRTQAQSWRQAAADLTSLAGDADAAAGKALGAMTGDAGDAARQRWSGFVDPERGSLTTAARGAGDAADRLERAAEQVGRTKVELVRKLRDAAVNRDAAGAAAEAGHPAALAGIDPVIQGTAANVQALTGGLVETVGSAATAEPAPDVVDARPGASGGGHGLLGALGLPDVGAPTSAPEADAASGGHDGLLGSGDRKGNGVLPGVLGALGDAAPGVLAGSGGSGVDVPWVPGVGSDAGGPVSEAVDGLLGGEHGAPGQDGPSTPGHSGTVEPGRDLLDGVEELVGGRPGGIPSPEAPGLGGPADLAGGGTPPMGVAHPPTAPPVAPGPATGPIVLPDAPTPPGGIAVPADAPTPPRGTHLSGLSGAPGVQPQGLPPQAGGAPFGGQLPPQPPASGMPPAGGGAPGPVAGFGAPAGGPVAGAPQPGVAGQFGAHPGGQPAGPPAGGQPRGGQPAAPAYPPQGQPRPPQPAPYQPGPHPAPPPPGPHGQPGQQQGYPGQPPAAPRNAPPQARPVQPGWGPMGEPQPPAPNPPPQAPGAPPLGSPRQERESVVALFLVHMFPIGHLPVASDRPARQLPVPASEPAGEPAVGRFAPHDHPSSDVIDPEQALDLLHQGARQPAPPPATVLPCPPAAVREGHDPLGGMHERDWDTRFLLRSGEENSGERQSGEGHSAPQSGEESVPQSGEQADGSTGEPTDGPAGEQVQVAAPAYVWPPADTVPEGCSDTGEPELLTSGTVLDRFGTAHGRVFSADGTPFAQRSLPPTDLDAGYRRYRVLRDVPVWRGVSAGWFGQPGGGVRYRSVYSAAELVTLGYLADVTFESTDTDTDTDSATTDEAPTTQDPVTQDPKSQGPASHDKEGDAP